MTSPELAIVPKTANAISIGIPTVPTMQEIDALNAMCKIAAYSGFLNSTSRDNTQRAADAFFVMMYGRELGIPAMTALKTIYVIDGKPSCSGQALLALMRKGGVEVDMPDPGSVTDKAVVKVKRPGATAWKSYTYTLAMAEKARLLGKDNWKKAPAEMLIWRAVSTACRFEAPDIVGGLYTIEELTPDTPVNEQGDPLDMPMISQSVPETAPDETPKSDPVPDREESPDIPEQQPPAASVGVWQFTEKSINDLMFQTLDWKETRPERYNTIQAMYRENAFATCTSLKECADKLRVRLDDHHKVDLSAPPDDKSEGPRHPLGEDVPS